MRLPQDVMSICRTRTECDLPCRNCKAQEQCAKIKKDFKVERPMELYTINNHTNGGAKNGIKQD